MKSIVFFLLIIALPVCLQAQTHYKVYSTAEKKLVSLDDVVRKMDNADVLFFGEEHNDSVGHIIESTLWQKLVVKYPAKAALSLEMFETDIQPVLNEYLAGQVSEKYLVKDARAWPNYPTDYRPMLELAKTSHLPVIAANAPGRYTNMSNRLGLAALQQLSTQSKAYLPPLPIDTATGAYYEKFSQLMGGHGSMGGMQLYQAQNLWDATMGWSIANYYKSHKGAKIFQVNGGFHSEEKLGAVAQLKRYAPQARVINIAAYASPEELSNPNWTKYSQMADYIILTDFKAKDDE